MTSIFFFCILLALAALCASADFSLKPDLCFRYDRCSPKSRVQTCSCDSDCHEYGTCCNDISKPRRDSPTFQCYSLRIARPVFAKKSCSEHFRGHVGTAKACLEEVDDEMDVKNTVLVTSRTTRVTYWNKQCASCNDENASDLEFWDIVVSCPSHEWIDKYSIRTNLTFDQDFQRWGLEIGGDFLKCFVRYSPLYGEKVKHCAPNIITECPDGYNDEAVSAKCSQYYAERKLKNSDTYYKNTHCAICNGVSLTDLECPGMLSAEDDADEMDFQDMVEEVFTDGQWLQREYGKNFECSEGFKYDPFVEKCRTYKIIDKSAAISVASHQHRTGFLAILATFAAFLYKMDAFEHLFAPQRNI